MEFQKGVFYPARDLDQRVGQMKFLRQGIVGGKSIAAFYDPIPSGYWIKGPLGPQSQIGFIYLGVNPQELFADSTEGAELASYFKEFAATALEELGLLLVNQQLGKLGKMAGEITVLKRRIDQGRFTTTATIKNQLITWVAVFGVYITYKTLGWLPIVGFLCIVAIVILINLRK